MQSVAHRLYHVCISREGFSRLPRNGGRGACVNPGAAARQTAAAQGGELLHSGGKLTGFPLAAPSEDQTGSAVARPHRILQHQSLGIARHGKKGCHGNASILFLFKKGMP